MPIYSRSPTADAVSPLTLSLRTPAANPSQGTRSSVRASSGQHEPSLGDQKPLRDAGLGTGMFQSSRVIGAAEARTTAWSGDAEVTGRLSPQRLGYPGDDFIPVSQQRWDFQPRPVPVDGRPAPCREQGWGPSLLERLLGCGGRWPQGHIRTAVFGAATGLCHSLAAPGDTGGTSPLRPQGQGSRGAGLRAGMFDQQSLPTAEGAPLS